MDNLDAWTDVDGANQFVRNSDIWSGRADVFNPLDDLVSRLLDLSAITGISGGVTDLLGSAEMNLRVV